MLSHFFSEKCFIKIYYALNHLIDTLLRIRNKIKFLLFVFIICAFSIFQMEIFQEIPLPRGTLSLRLKYRFKYYVISIFKKCLASFKGI